MNMNKKFGVLMTALLTVGSTAYANDNFDPGDEDDSSAPAIQMESLDASPVIVIMNDDDPIKIKEMVTFKTTGESMAQYLVTINGGEPKTWVAAPSENCAGGGDSADRGAVDGTDWSLEVCDTWYKMWVLTAGVGITSIKMEAIIDVDGNGEAAVFDVIYWPVQTPGSSRGREFSGVNVGSFDGTVIATYSRPVQIWGDTPPAKQDLYAVLELEFVELDIYGQALPKQPLAFTGTMTFRADADNVKLKGCCCLDFEPNGFSGYDGNYPLYLNNAGNNTHLLPAIAQPQIGKINKFISCYDYIYPTLESCQKLLGKTKHIWWPLEGGGQDAEVKSTHWFNFMNGKELLCSDLNKEPWLIIPKGVKLLATGVNLIVTPNAQNPDHKDLTLTTTTEKGTAKLLILRGEEVGDRRWKLSVACEFNMDSDSNTEKSYSCTDTTPANAYWAAEIEDDGDFIIQMD
ncbi:MAG: hypothetical protein KAI83_10355 [Thiomargarita sp.]|nr:hypothetical protein [Thiomargarita sp.]